VSRTSGLALPCVQVRQLAKSLFRSSLPNGCLRRAVRDDMYIGMCVLYNQRDTTYTMFFIIISALNVAGGFSAHHQELIKLRVQAWVLSCFPAVYRWCGWVGNYWQYTYIYRLCKMFTVYFFYIGTV
jgi:hypothetical protein